MSTSEASRGPISPLKHVLLYSWELKTAADLSDVARRLREAKFYVVGARKDVIVATSLARPGVVIFIIIEKEPGRGDIVLIQGPRGPYSFEEIVRAMPTFARIAGIRLTGSWRGQSLGDAGK